MTNQDVILSFTATVGVRNLYYFLLLISQTASRSVRQENTLEREHQEVKIIRDHSEGKKYHTSREYNVSNLLEHPARRRFGGDTKPPRQFCVTRVWLNGALPHTPL